MKKKNYIREGGICQFWDQWAGDKGYIDYQELAMAMLNGGKKKDEAEPVVREFYQDVQENSNTEEQSNSETSKDILFNRDYKDYGKED